MSSDRQYIGRSAIGQMYIDSDQVLNLAVATTYYQVVGATADIQNNVTIASSRMTVKQEGYYQIEFSSSFTHATNNTTVHLSLFVDGIEDTRLEIQRKVGTGGDIGATSTGGTVYLTAGQVIDVRAKTLSNTGNLTTSHFNFNAHLVV